MRLINYKFRANNAPLHELSQFTLISIQIHKRPLMRGKYFSLFSCCASTFFVKSRIASIYKDVPLAPP